MSCAIVLKLFRKASFCPRAVLIFSLAIVKISEDALLELKAAIKSRIFTVKDIHRTEVNA